MSETPSVRNWEVEKLKQIPIYISIVTIGGALGLKALGSTLELSHPYLVTELIRFQGISAVSLIITSVLVSRISIGKPSDSVVFSFSIVVSLLVFTEILITGWVLSTASQGQMLISILPNATSPLLREASILMILIAGVGFPSLALTTEYLGLFQNTHS